MTLWPIAPEIALTILAILVLCLDLIFLRAPRKGWLGLVSAVGVFGVLAFMVWLRATTPAATGTSGLIPGVSADAFSFAFRAIVLIAAALACLASVSFAHKHLRYQGEFFSLILFSALGFMFMVSAVDLIMLYLGLELGTLSLYALAAMQKDRPRSGEAGLKFLIMGAASSAAFLYGASLLYGAYGTTVFAAMSVMETPTPVSSVGIVLILAALGFKITAVPFHMWAPDVYQGAPTPVTAFLSVASKSAGFGALLRLLMGPLFPQQMIWMTLVGLLAGLSMIAGNLLALPQTNIKRLLAYSGIAQAGYILIALAAVNERGVTAITYFLFQYAFTNLGAFIVVILVGSALGNDEISSYAGLSRRNPLIAMCMLVLLLSLGGIPPLSGFWGKVFLFWSGVESQDYFLVLIGALASVVALYYYLMVARRMYIDEPVDPTPIAVSRPAALALALCTIAVVALGYPKPWIAIAQAASHVFPGLQ